MSELSPTALHQQAAPLLGDEATRSQGLRLTAQAALRQGAVQLALDATDALLRRRDSSPEDLILRARALTGAGLLAETLERLADAAPSGAVFAARAIARVLLGMPREAREAARQALWSGELDTPDTLRLRWLESYAAALSGDPAAPPAPALETRWRGPPPADPTTPVFALLDYKAPDVYRNSSNLGDWMQSLAAMRQLARLDGVEWSFDDPDLAPLMARLQADLEPAKRVSVTGRAHLTVIDRDFAPSATPRGGKLWLLGNGWYAAPVFGETRAWPAAINVEPVLLSVHMSQTRDLSPDRLDWLKAKGPVGCRDLATLAWLRNQDVPAFFSGCLTMTLGAKARGVGGERLLVDAPADEADWTALTHDDPGLRQTGFALAATRALDLLERYAAAERIRTGRLHCALPARAVGAAVEFIPPRPSDRRFNGLTDLDTAAFQETAHRLDSVLAEVLPKIVGGQSVEAVRGIFARQVGDLPSGRRWRTHPKVSRGPASHEVSIAVAFDATYAPMCRTLLASVRRHTSARLRLIMLVRGVDEAEARRVAAVAEPFEVRILPMDGALEGVPVQLLHQITISTMDRLFLADLAPDLDRLVYLDCDTLVIADIAELAAIEPGETGIAARRVPHTGNLAMSMERRCRDLDAAAATALRDWSADNADLASAPFNAGVMVLSLGSLRVNGIMARAVELAGRFSLHDQDALNLASGGQAADLPVDWNAMPGIDLTVEPKLIHWVGRAKPWTSAVVRYESLWKAEADLARPKVDRDYWLDPSNYPADWDRRAEMAAAWLPTSGRIVEVGCGAPMALRGFLDPAVTYVPSDLKAWTPDVQVIDLDAGEFPSGRFDAVAMLGVIEYLTRPGLALLRARRASDCLVTSYAHPIGPGSREHRAARGWLNDFKVSGFESLLGRHGWAIEDRVLFAKTESMEQFVYRCARCELVKPPTLGGVATAVRAERLTYLRPEKMARLEIALDRVLSNGAPGDFVEFGVALGGSAIVIADRARRAGRRFMGFDVFGMIPPPQSEADDEASRGRYAQIAGGQSKGIGDDLYYGYRPDLHSEVIAAFARHGLVVDGEGVALVKGLFHETWPAYADRTIALAHIDCDWHAPVAFCLEAMGRALAPGGALVIDDYHDYSGARAAVDAFMARHPDFRMEDGPNPILTRALGA